MSAEPEQRIPVGISSCLLGEKVRYDGDDELQHYLAKLTPYFEFKSFCPEMAIGLGVPRAPIRLVLEEDEVRCLGTVQPIQDHTAALSACSQQHWLGSISGYILKQSSPSCGISDVKLYRGGQMSRTGTGIFAASLMLNYPDLPVVDEASLADPRTRADFISRVQRRHAERQSQASAPDRPR